MSDTTCIFDRLLDRRNTGSVKWDKQGVDRLPFGIADMDFETFPEMRRALIDRIEDGTFGYTFETDSFFESVIGWFKTRHGLDLRREDILTVAGTLESLSLILDTFFDAGDAIVLCPPVYHPFRTTLERFDITAALTPLVRTEGRYYMDFAGIEAALRNGAKAVILCSPHNPVGRVWTQEELFQIVELCLRYDALLLSDEIHCDIVYGDAKEHQRSALSAHPEADRCTIVMTAASKTFNIPGFKCSLVFVKDPVLREKLAFTVKKFHNEVNLAGLAATEAAYRNGGAWVDQLVAYLWENILFTKSYLADHLPSVKVTEPEATYLMWLDFSAYGLTQEKLMNLMSEEARVTVGSGTVSGENGKGFIRLNVGTPRSILEKGLESICRTFAGYERRV